MRIRFKRDRREAGGRPPQGKPLVDRLKAGAAVLAISVAGCTMNTGGIPVVDGATDTREDTVVVNLDKGPDSRIDSKIVPDQGPDKSEPDMVIDSKVPDKGSDQLYADFNKPDVVTDTWTDSGVDTGPDQGIVCSGVANDSVSTKLINTGNSIVVGGYKITNNGPASGGITVDIECDSGSSSIKNNVFCKEGGPETVVAVPADGKKIRLYNIGSNPSVASMTINVGTL